MTRAELERAFALCVAADKALTEYYAKLITDSDEALALFRELLNDNFSSFEEIYD